MVKIYLHTLFVFLCLIFKLGKAPDMVRVDQTNKMDERSMAPFVAHYAMEGPPFCIVVFVIFC